MTATVIDQLRVMCMAFPEATEQSEGSVGRPVFKVRGKIFAMQHGIDRRPSLWCKSTLAFQEMLVASEPQRYFVPPYVGQHGWIGVWLDGEIDWNFATELITESYRKTAPKRLSAMIDQHKGKLAGGG